MQEREVFQQGAPSAAARAADGHTEKKSRKEKREEKKRRKKAERQKRPWIFWGALVSAAFALVIIGMYDIFRNKAEAYESSPLEYYENIDWLYQSSYLLYKDLYNMQTDDKKSYNELYLEPEEGYEWILSSEAWLDGWAEDETVVQSKEELMAEQEEDFYLLREGINSCDNFFDTLEASYSSLNNHYNYVIRDHKTGVFLTNMSEEELSRDLSEQFFLISFEFNENGIVTVGQDVAGMNAAQVRKFANEVIRISPFSSFLDEERAAKYITLKAPVDCSVVFCVSKEDWALIQKESAGRDFTGYYVNSDGDIFYTYSATSDWAYREAHAEAFLFSFLALAFLFGLFLPVMKESKPWREVKAYCLPLEILFAMGIVLCAGIGQLIFKMMVYAASGLMDNSLYNYLGDVDAAQTAFGCINFTALAAFFFCGWYLGVCARAVRDFGIKEYIRQRCIFYKIFPFLKSKLLGIYDEVCHFDVTKDAHKMILKMVLINALILFVISSLWFGGFAITVIYSVILYVILRKYISDLQKKYGLLLHATNEIAEGNLNVAITEDLGVFEPFKPQVIRIQSGFKNAVEEEMKSQRMKAELITNVSHDLKTPLTAIITYINLLKEEGVTEEQRKEYLDTLERKSIRLKVLIEDLFEVSKATSQTIKLNIMDVDIMNLVKQVSFEMSDKLEASDLDVRMNLADEKIILPLDSQKTYRIYENLMANIAKYALPGTRVYINGFRIDDTVIITMKNISAQEITVDISELTERFVRGDSSRNTEGSGLGLAIAKSFVELQGGELTLEVDGDLFKVTTTWKIV